MRQKEIEFLDHINKHKGIIVKVSRVYMDTPDDQEDLQQEIIFQLWQSYHKFKGKSQFSSWMYRVAINTAITFFKKEKQRVDTGSMPTHFEKITDDSADSKRAKLDQFYQAVYSLNKIEKALILLYIEGLPQKEIAKNLGLTPVNTRVKLNRTKQKIKAIIKTQGYEF